MNSAMIQAFAALEAHRPIVAQKPLRERFEEDPERFKQFSISFGDLLLDYSKNLVDEETMRLLVALAEVAEVEKHRAAMFAGEAINKTEKRSVLHVALRALPDEVYRSGGENVVPEVHAVLNRMAAFSDGVRSGTIRGAGGQFTDVVNIGIGGSDLGPRMAVKALSPYHDGPRVHFVSNVDGADIRDTLAGLQPDRTLFLIASKTFTTLETMTNAATARAWIVDRVGEDHVGRPFCCHVDSARQGRRIRHLAGPRVRLLGLGRRPLFGLVGDRPVADDRHRAGRLHPLPRRRPGDGRSFPHRAARSQSAGNSRPRWHLASQYLGVSILCGAALRAAAGATACLFPAARYGIGRQAGADGRRNGHGRHRAAGLRRARHQWSARLLSAPPPGDRHHPLRLHGRRAVRCAGRRRPPGPPYRQLSRPDPGADAGAHHRRSAQGDERAGHGGGGHRAARAAQGLPRQSTDQHDRLQAARPGDARA